MCILIYLCPDPDGGTTVVEREEGWFGSEDVTVTQTDEYGNTTVVSKACSLCQLELIGMII